MRYLVQRQNKAQIIRECEQNAPERDKTQLPVVSSQARLRRRPARCRRILCGRSISSSTPTSARIGRALQYLSSPARSEKKPQEKITWGHGCSGCNGPDSKQLHRLEPCILIARKTLAYHLGFLIRHFTGQHFIEQEKRAKITTI